MVLTNVFEIFAASFGSIVLSELGDKVSIILNIELKSNHSLDLFYCRHYGYEILTSFRFNRCYFSTNYHDGSFMCFWGCHSQTYSKKMDYIHFHASLFIFWVEITLGSLQKRKGENKFLHCKKNKNYIRFRK